MLIQRLFDSYAGSLCSAPAQTVKKRLKEMKKQRYSAVHVLRIWKTCDTVTSSGLWNGDARRICANLRSAFVMEFIMVATESREPKSSRDESRCKCLVSSEPRVSQTTDDLMRSVAIIKRREYM